MHPKYQKAKEHSDPHQGDGGGGSEELPVVDAKVPHHRQHHHEHGDHQAAGAHRHPRGPEPPRHLGPDLCSGRGLLVRGGFVKSRWDVAVDDAVVGDVEGKQSPPGVLQQLPSIDEFDLMLPTGEIFTKKSKMR